MGAGGRQRGPVRGREGAGRVCGDVAGCAGSGAGPEPAACSNSLGTGR